MRLHIRTADGKRLWFPVTVRDWAGILTLFMSEAAVLKLSGFSDPDLFEAAFMEGKAFIRRIKRSSAAQPADQQTQSSTDQPADQVDVHIVHAACHDFTESPSRPLRLLPAWSISSKQCCAAVSQSCIACTVKRMCLGQLLSSNGRHRCLQLSVCG